MVGKEKSEYWLTKLFEKVYVPVLGLSAPPPYAGTSVILSVYLFYTLEYPFSIYPACRITSYAAEGFYT